MSNNTKIYEESIKRIQKMGHEEMASLWRFAPIGHPYFNVTLPMNAVFKKRFEEFGGMTTEISKLIEL